MQSQTEGLHIGIDATNIRQGGGVTHLSRMLEAADPALVGCASVTVWTCAPTALRLPRRPWLTVKVPDWADRALPVRWWRQLREISREIDRAGCDVLFAPGGTLPSCGSVPTVTMSQNMLPFEADEAARFGRLHPMRLKMSLLRLVQGRSLQNADGVIFLTRYARTRVIAALGGLRGEVIQIPHGVESRFRMAPRTPRPLNACSADDPFRVLYVSIQMPYKHQLALAEAIALLRERGLPVAARFIGAPWGWYGRALSRRCSQLDPGGDFLEISGEVAFSDLHECYRGADAFVFASSCENLPNILIEAMSAGLPIACSNRGPMPEVLGSAGVYFDPCSVAEIAAAIERLVVSPELRKRLAEEASVSAQQYSWERCANETMAFVARVARGAGR